MHEWWSVLQLSSIEARSKPICGSLRLGVSIITVQMPVEGPCAKARWLQARDALELLFLQLKIARGAFMKMTREFYLIDAGSASEWADLDLDATVPCELKVTLSSDLTVASADPTWVLWLLWTLLEPVALQDRLKPFLKARAKLLATAALEVRSLSELLKVSVLIDIRLSETNVVCAILALASKLRRDLTAAETKNNSQPIRCGVLQTYGYRYPFQPALVELITCEAFAEAEVIKALEVVVAAPGLHLLQVQYQTIHLSPNKALGDMVTLLMASSGSEGGGRESTLFLADNMNEHPSRCSTAHTFSYVLSALLMPNRFDTVNLMSALDALDTTSRRHV